jgi:hypothetical protein
MVGGVILADAASKQTGMGIKQLREQTVSPGQTEQGFVYFKVPAKGLTNGMEFTARVRLPRLGTDQSVEVQLPLHWERK